MKKKIKVIKCGKEYLQEIFNKMDDPDSMEGTLFRIKGKRDVYQLSGVVLHYCFAIRTSYRIGSIGSNAPVIYNYRCRFYYR